MKEPRPARGLLVLVPFMVLWLLAWALEEGVGFAPAYGQASTTRTIHSVPQSSVPNPSSSVTNPENPTTRSTLATTTTDTPNPTLPPTTYMPPTSRVPRGTFPSATPQSDGVADCAERSPGVGILYRCGNSNWICRPKVATVGTYCIDP